MEQVLHELQVHQVELELQNEALREAQVALEDSRDRYMDLYDFAPVGYLTLDAAGQIAEINLTGAALLGEVRGKLVHRRFSNFVVAEDREAWQRHFQHAICREGKWTCELRLKRSDRTVFAACLDCLLATVDGAMRTLRITLTDITERTQAERKLREMAQFPEENPNPVLRIGRDGILLYANTAAQRFLDILGGPREQTPEVLRALAESALHQRQMAETEIAGLDGQAFWIGAVWPEDENYVNIYARDISAKWRAGMALQESETRFRAMADAAPALIWMAGVDKGCTWCNQQWLEFTGRTMAQEIDNGWMASLHRADFDYCRRIFNDAFDRRERFEMEFRLRRADGQYRWLLNSGVPRFAADQEFLGYIGSCIDITRLKRADEDLNRAQSVGHIGSWRYDALRNLMVGSHECHRIVGNPEGVPLHYETLLAKVHPDDVGYVDKMWRAWLQGGSYDIEHRLVVDGQVKWVRERAESEFDAQGTLIGGFGIVQDITERQKTVAELRHAKERLERLAEDQAGHLRSLASELTQAEQSERDRLYERLHGDVQPLLVAARLSLSGLTARTPQKDSLRVTAEACEHISQVLGIARNLSLQLSPPLIRERGLAPALESLCRWVKDNHGLRVDLSSVPEVESEDLTMRMLCFNAVRELLMNVVKHAETRHATLALQVGDRDTLRITVADRGSGFDPGAITNGTGLVAIERRLGMLGGSLQIDSRPGRGTVVTLSAPLRPAAVAR